MTEERDRVQAAQWVLERHLAWVAAAEAKVGAVVTLDTALLAGLAAAYGASAPGARTAWAFFFGAAAALLTVIGLACAAVALKPRTGGPMSSLVFFARIEQLSSSDYRSQFAKATLAEYLSDLTSQVHRNAEIASVKFKWISLSIRWSFAAAGPWLFSIFLFVRP